MNDTFDFEVFRSKAKLVLDTKNLVTAGEYVVQMENLLLSVNPGSHPNDNINEISLLHSHLDKARSRIQSLFYNAPIGYCVLDENGFLVTANKAFCHVLLLDQPVVEGENLRNYIHIESIELFNFQIRKVLSSETTLSTNLRFFQKEKELQIRFLTTYYKEKEGDKNYLQCIATEITDAKAIENELVASEAQFYNLLEACPVGILVMHKSCYIYSNKAAAEIFGYESPDALRGLNALDTISTESKPVYEERIQRLENNLSNPPQRGIFICRDGSEKQCETISIPVIYNNRLSALILISDLHLNKNESTDIPKNIADYKEMYQLLRRMCDNVPDMIWAKDLNNQYIFTNKAMSEGILNASDTNEPIGKTEAFFVQRQRDQHPENSDWHTFGNLSNETDTRVMQSGEAYHNDEYGNIKGQFCCLDVYKAPFYDSDNRLIGTVGSGRDVT